MKIFVSVSSGLLLSVCAASQPIQSTYRKSSGPWPVPVFTCSFQTGPLMWPEKPETPIWAVGRFEEALPWFERAVAKAEKDDVHGREQKELVKSLIQALAGCLVELGHHEDARQWQQRSTQYGNPDVP
jgi:hypothetical protein